MFLNSVEDDKIKFIHFTNITYMSVLALNYAEMNQPQPPPAGNQSGGDRLERCGLPFSIEMAGQSGEGRHLKEGGQCL